MVSDVLRARFQGKSCHVIGYGRSNRPLARMLLDCGASVTVHDSKAEIANENETLQLMNRGMGFVLGENYLDALSGADYIFRTPGIRPDLPEIASAVSNGAVLTSEMELFFDVCPCNIIGITGSDGKTTTTTLTHLFLKTELEKEEEREAYVGGNIGAPLLPIVDRMQEGDFAVVELSSFQLQTFSRSPSRALITNISPNHLNWHTDMDEYIGAKCNIYRHMGAELLVTNADNEITAKIAENSDLPVIYFSSTKVGYQNIVPSLKKGCLAIYDDGGIVYIDDGSSREEILKVSDILLPGRHNVENYMSAIALTHGYVSSKTVRDIARTFGGVEHRLELVRNLRGVRYYNSSIDSSPTRTSAALGAIDKAPIIICGGSDKNIAFDGLAIDLCTKVKAVVLTGEAAPKILAALEACPLYSKDKINVIHLHDFKDAVMEASKLAEEGDIVLLSPACASFDAFDNFEHRGRTFKKIVNELE